MTSAFRQFSHKIFLPFGGAGQTLNHIGTEKVLRTLTGNLTSGRITFTMDDGQEIVCDSGCDGPAAEMRLHTLKAVRRLVTAGYVGLAEGYLEGDWTTPSLATIFDFGTANVTTLDQSLTGNLPIRMIHGMAHLLRRNSKQGSRKNIAEHYDLGNEFFTLWLDPSMTYSSALFSGKENENLTDAQQNKYRRIVTELGINSTHRVLEIGCGWGGFIEFAARETGAHVTALTISPEQFAFAQKRISDAGLADRVDIRLQDYRDTRGEFDRVVSIEMLEAVGEAYWPTYFGSIANRLVKGGSAMIQGIIVPDHRFEGYRKSVDFIQRYIFPGGMLMCPAKINEHSQKAGLSVADAYMFRESYSRTLDLWGKKFEEQWANIAPLGFDQRFKRMWEYYLAYTSAGFRAGTIDLGQFLLRKP